MRQRYLFGRVEQYPPAKTEQIGCVSRKITRNLALNRYKRNHAAKRGGEQVEIALSELENCIPDVKGVEQVAEEALLVSVINRFWSLKQKRNAIFLFSDTGSCIRYGILRICTAKEKAK